MNPARLRTASLVAASTLLFVVGSARQASAITAPPPKDCDTPNASGGIGVLEQPQSINPSTQQPYLTKALSNTISQPGSTTYQFTLTTARTSSNDSGSGGTVTYMANSLTDTSKTWATNQWVNATVSVNAGAQMATVAGNNANTLTLTAPWSGGAPAAGAPYVLTFFNELLDCAWDVTEGGNAATATYGTQQNAPTFTSQGQLTIGLDVNNSDVICDRVELKGTTPQGVPFTDYSNLVGSPNGTTCSPATTAPEVPMAALILAAGGGAVGAFLYLRRRRGRALPAA